MYWPDARVHEIGDYRETLLSIGCAIVDAAGPITFKHLCDRMARLHGFQRTGSEIKRTIWRVIHRARARSRGPDDTDEFWPKDVHVAAWIPFRGMMVDGVVRSWSDLPFPEKLGLARAILAQNDSDPEFAMSRQVGLSRLRANTRQEIEAIVAVAQDELKSAGNWPQEH